jgi:hypothetical protein
MAASDGSASGCGGAILTGPIWLVGKTNCDPEGFGRSAWTDVKSADDQAAVSGRWNRSDHSYRERKTTGRSDPLIQEWQ